MRELKKSTKLDFEQDKYHDIRDVVTTIVHNHLSTTTPRDVERHILALDNENNKAANQHGRQHDHEFHAGDAGYEEYEDGAQTEQNNEDDYSVNFVGKGAHGWQPKGKGKRKSRFEGVCWNRGKAGHRRRECYMSRGKSKGKGKDDVKGGSREASKARCSRARARPERLRWVRAGLVQLLRPAALGMPRLSPLSRSRTRSRTPVRAHRHQITGSSS